jgi:DNA helicase-2/ATP-dependent DNA helicase PcrA
MTYTNVAADEVCQALREYMGMEVKYPHFLGTIDSFLDKHVFLPHAHRLIGKRDHGKVRILTGDVGRAKGAYPVWLGDGHPAALPPGSARKGRVTEFNAVDVVRLPDGTCVLKSRIPGRHGTCAKCCGRTDKSPCSDRKYNCGKLKMAYDGIATHDDAMFWALEILRRWKDVLARLAQRFSVLLVDELQDTKPTQLEALKLIRDTCQCRFFVAFDPDQAIYEYAHAHPEACSLFATGFSGRSVSCTFRSTQEICNAVHPFSTLPLPASSQALHREHRGSCFVLKYVDTSSALRQFANLATERGLALQKCAVLVRKSDSVEEVKAGTGATDMKGAGSLARALLSLYPLLAQGDLDAAHRRLADAVLDNDMVERPSSGDRATRRLLERELDGRCGQVLGQLLSLSNLCYSEWAHRMKGLLSGVFRGVEVPPQSLRRPTSMREGPPLRELLPELQRGESISTAVSVSNVHRVKGKNLQGAMLLTMMTKKYDTDWLDAPKGENGFWPEETRVSYVAMTRAERLLVVAIPANAPNSVFEHPKLRGFTLLDDTATNHATR